MFAGLPGIGVGTLFYVLAAFWMPFQELARLARGESSAERWFVISRQMFYALSIVVTVMFSERMLMWALGDSQIKPLSPATWLHKELGATGANSIWAAPVMASILLMGGVLLSVEVLRLIVKPSKPAAVEPIVTDELSEEAA